MNIVFLSCGACNWLLFTVLQTCSYFCDFEADAVNRDLKFAAVGAFAFLTTCKQLVLLRFFCDSWVFRRWADDVPSQGFLHRRVASRALQQLRISFALIACVVVAASTSWWPLAASFLDGRLLANSQPIAKMGGPRFEPIFWAQNWGHVKRW